MNATVVTRTENNCCREANVLAPLPCWRVYAKVFLIDCVEWNKVFHASHIQVDQDNVLHLPASAVQLTWTQATHYTVYHCSVYWKL